MRAVFFSDAHLRGADSEDSLLLMDFLRGMPRDLDHLFVVGDLFDFWFAKDGVVYPGFQPVIAELTALKDTGTRVHLFEGNHDFYLADYFTRHRGIEVYPDSSVMQLEGKKLFIAHGDTADDTDRGYRFLRKILRSRFFYSLQKQIPLSMLWKIAQMSSDTSKTYLAKPQEGLAAKLEAFALAKFEEGVDAVILGHCHLPVIRTHRISGGERQFILLGDWLRHRSYAVMEGDRFTLRRFGS